MQTVRAKRAIRKTSLRNTEAMSVRQHKRLDVL